MATTVWKWLRAHANWGCVFTWVVVGGWLRASACRESLWIDELHTAWCVDGPLAEVASRAAAGNQTAVFFWAEWLLVWGLGPCEWTLRLLSWVASVTGIAAAYALIHRVTGDRGWAVAVTAVAALDRHCLFYGSEARPYAIVSLLALLHIWSSISSVNSSGRLCLGPCWIVTAVLMVYVHLSSLWFLFWEYMLLWLSWAMSKRRGAEWRQLVVAGLFLSLALVPLFPVGARIQHELPEFSLLVPTVALLDTLSVLNWAYYVGPLWLLLFTATILRRKVSAVAGGRGVSYYLAALTVLPVATAALVTSFGIAPLLFPRYLISIQAASWLATASAGAAIRRELNLGWLNHIALLLFGVVVIGTNASWWKDLALGEPLRREDWRSALSVLDTQWQTGDLILLRPGLIETERALPKPDSTSLAYDYVRFPLRTFYSERVRHAPVIVLDNSDRPVMSTTDRMELHRAARIYLLVRGNAARAEELANYLCAQSTHRLIIRQTYSFERVHLIVLSREGGFTVE